MNKLFTTLATAALAFGFAAAPVTVNLSAGVLPLVAAQAFARKGADDAPGHVRGGHGADDGAYHDKNDDKGGERDGKKDPKKERGKSGKYESKKSGRGDDKGGKYDGGKKSGHSKNDDKGGKSGGGGHDDGPNHR